MGAYTAPPGCLMNAVMVSEVALVMLKFNTSAQELVSRMYWFDGGTLSGMQGSFHKTHWVAELVYSNHTHKGVTTQNAVQSETDRMVFDRVISEVAELVHPEFAYTSLRSRMYCFDGGTLSGMQGSFHKTHRVAELTYSYSTHKGVARHNAVQSESDMMVFDRVISEVCQFVHPEFSYTSPLEMYWFDCFGMQGSFNKTHWVAELL
jgi:hypothetical protein